MTARNRADAFASVGLFERRGRKPVTTHQSRGCHSARPTGRRQNLGGCDQRAAQTEEPQGHGIFHKKLLPRLYCRGWVSSVGETRRYHTIIYLTKGYHLCMIPS